MARPVSIRSPGDARRLGIGMVFQDFVQVPAFSVADNIALFLPDLPWVLDARALAARIEATSERYGLRVDPAAPLGRLSIGERQRVEIVKLLLAEARLLILDEPTRSLAPHEVDSLFRVFAGLRADGYAVVFITHKMPEVLACADRITVLRRGRVTGTLRRAEATAAGLVSLMFGETLDRAGGRSHGGAVSARRRAASRAAWGEHSSRRPGDRARRRGPRRAGAARSSASPAWRATGSASSGTWCWGSRRARRGRSGLAEMTPPAGRWRASGRPAWRSCPRMPPRWARCPV